MPSREERSVDDLRRRLYEPGATRDDLDRFRAAQAPEEPAAAPPPPRRRRAVIGGAVGAVVVVAAVTALVLGGRGPVAPPAVHRSAAAQDQPVLAPQSVRAGFVRALAASSPAGILPYLQAHPEARPAALLTRQRADSTEYAGEGTTVLRLAPSALAERGGHLTVIVVTASAAAYGWRATVPAADARVSTVATHRGAASPGLPLSRTVAYARAAPTALTVTVPGRVRWGVVVDFTD